MPTWAMWSACLFLLLLRALLAAADSALYGTSDQRASELQNSHKRAGARVLWLKRHREAGTAAVRTGMTLFGFLAAAIGMFVPPKLLQFTRFGDSSWLSLFTVLSSALLVGILASLLDVTFRAAASGKPERWALGLSGFLALNVWTLYPLMRVLVGTMNLVLRPFGTQVRFEAPPPPLEDLENLLAAQAIKEGVDKSAPQLIRSIFEMSDKTCRDVMVPRTEVTTIPLGTPPKEILRVLAEENHSRMPVYQDDPDHIIGILHVRDMIPMMENPELIVLPDIIRPAHFVPWMKSIGDMLREMQRRKIHMAMVVDEYGGFMGIVTLEDILREIVGDIGDEFEVEVKQIDRQPDGTLLVDATMDIGEFAKHFSLPIPEGEYETLGGFLSSHAGRIPDVGDKFTLYGWQFIVQNKVGPRLDRIRLVRPTVRARVES